MLDQDMTKQPKILIEGLPGNDNSFIKQLFLLSKQKEKEIEQFKTYYYGNWIVETPNKKETFGD